MFKSATVKLTLYYMAILTAICLTFSIVVYHFASIELRHGLYSQSQRLTNQFPGFDFDPALKPRVDSATSDHRLLLHLIYFDAVVLVLAGFASYGLARSTLRPIEESHEQQKRFTADVSHELRTPLTALKMSTEVVLMDKAAGKQELLSALEDNLEEADKLQMLVNNLFRLTRLETSELQGQFGPVNLSDVVTEATSHVAKAAAGKSIKIVNDLPLDLTTSGDRTSLEQLVTIFLDNAVKYSPDKSTVRVSGQASVTEVKLSIADRGMGIAAGDLPHVFERFYRADTARTRSDASGFGLGLSIAKMIADLHDSNIEVTSEAGKGTTVTLTLPAQKP